MNALSTTLAVAVGALCPLALGCSVRCDVPSDCDVRDDGCQQQVIDALQCVRGGERAEVPIRIVDAEDYADDRVDEIDPEQAEQGALWYRGLAHFDLVSDVLTVAEATRADADRVGGFYDSDTRDITIVSHGERIDGFSAVSLLAHELVHAQQDAEHSFEALSDRYATSFDAELALDAVIEGEAVLYSSQVLAYALGFELDDIRWDETLRDATQDARVNAAEDDDPYLQLRWSFAYRFGARYVNEAFDAGGTEEVAAIYDEPPVSTRQVMQGYGQSPLGGKPWLEPELTEQAVPELDGFPTHVATAQLGAYALELAIEHWFPASGREHADAQRIGSRLRADAFTVLDGDGVAASWRLRFADEGTAEQAAQLIDRGLLHVNKVPRIAVVDRDVLVVLMAGEAAAIDVATVPWGPVPDDADASMAEPQATRGSARLGQRLR